MTFTAISSQDRVQKILKQAFLKDRIPSAYLFVGPDRDVKVNTAIDFAKLSNCVSENKICDKCEHCDKINRKVHPDVLIIEPEGSSIKIDQIRELAAFTRNGPILGKLKVVIVDLVDYMTNEAYTSFLKTLEEPANNVLFILLTTREGSIPDTVASRCQKIVFSEDTGNLAVTDEESLFFNDLMNKIKKMDEGQLLNILNDSYDSEEVKITLNNLMIYLWIKARSEIINSKAYLNAFNVVSKCYHAVERRANLRLALDTMLINLKEAMNG